MVFPSIPVYLDPPNWQQQQPSHDDHFIGNGQLGVQLPPPHPTVGSTRPGSLTEQARLGKVPVPEPGLKCPRCESTNTKFCYYNNYSLTQPRHFCKTCRRYWTRGGALRNVPVGGGCRRNKRIKRRSSASKTPSTTMGSITTATEGGSSSLPPGSIAPPSLSFMAGSGDYMGGGEVGQISNNNSGSSGFLLGDLQQWRMQQQQLPYLANFGAPSSLPCGSTLFQFEGGEPINNGLNHSRHLVNLPAGNYDHQLSAGWPSHDVSGLFMSSTTTTHHDL